MSSNEVTATAEALKYAHEARLESKLEQLKVSSSEDPIDSDDDQDQDDDINMVPNPKSDKCWEIGYGIKYFQRDIRRQPYSPWQISVEHAYVYVVGFKIVVVDVAKGLLGGPGEETNLTYLLNHNTQIRREDSEIVFSEPTGGGKEYKLRLPAEQLDILCERLRYQAFTVQE